MRLVTVDILRLRYAYLLEMKLRFCHSQAISSLTLRSRGKCCTCGGSSHTNKTTEGNQAKVI